MASTALRLWWHGEDWIGTSTNRDALHSFWRVAINSVIEKRSRDPKTEEETFCKHRFKGRRSKMGYSTRLCVYLLPIYSPYVSANTCDPLETATRDAERPTSATTDPSTANSSVASMAKRSVTVTATRRKVPFSHVRMKAHNDSTRSSNSRLVSFCLTNHSRQNFGQHSSNDDRIKAKQQCESGKRRNGSGNQRNLPKLRLVSRLLLHSLARRLAQTAPRASQLVHSYLPSLVRPPSRTRSPELATEGRRHQLRQ